MDKENVENGVEKTLAIAFKKGIDQIASNNTTLELMNSNNYNYSFELIDFHNYFGVEIDRQSNKSKGIKESMAGFLNNDNVTIYSGFNPLDMIKNFSFKNITSPLKVTGLNVEFILKVKTNLKLNLKSRGS